MTPRQEKKLIHRLKLRDEKAFREIVTLYQHKVYNLVYRILGDHQEAEDVAQDVFLTVFKSIHTFRGDAKFSTWLYRIATNHSKNRIKYNSRRHQHKRTNLDDLEESRLTHPLAQGPARPDRVAMGRELENILQCAIASLDEEQRTLIVLREIENLSYAEISEISDLPVGTVKSRLHRARLQLKSIIDTYRAGEPSPKTTTARAPLSRRQHRKTRRDKEIPS